MKSTLLLTALAGCQFWGCKGGDGVDAARHGELAASVGAEIAALAADTSRPAVAPWAPKKCPPSGDLLAKARDRLSGAGALMPATWAEKGFDASTRALLDAHMDEVATWAAALVQRASCRAEGSPLGSGPDDPARARLAVKLANAVMAATLASKNPAMQSAVWSTIPAFALDLPRGRGRLEAKLAADVLETWLQLSERYEGGALGERVVAEHRAVLQATLDTAPPYGRLLRRDAEQISAAALHALKSDERLAPWAARLPGGTVAALQADVPGDALSQIAAFRARAADSAKLLSALDEQASEVLRRLAAEPLADTPLAGTLSAELAFTAPGEAYLGALRALKAQLAAQER